MRLDHVVVWVEDPVRSVEFFVEVVGLEPVRLEEFRAKKCMFPSVRVSEDTIIDVMPRAAAATVDKIPGAAGTAGHRVNHVCLAMTRAEYDALAARLDARGVHRHPMDNNFGARGVAKTFYFTDLDGNVFEARHYDA